MKLKRIFYEDEHGKMLECVEDYDSVIPQLNWIIYIKSKNSYYRVIDIIMASEVEQPFLIIRTKFIENGRTDEIL